MNFKKLQKVILWMILFVMLGIVSVNASVDRVADFTFDSNYYANSYSDLKAVLGTDSNALRTHFATWGIKEGRVASPIFDVKYYLAQYPDLQNAFGNDYEAAYNHFLAWGMKEGRIASPVFNVREYLDNYADLQNAFGNNYEAAYNHYLAWGMKEGRVSSNNFDVRHYLANYPDLQNAFGNDFAQAYNHYLVWGMKEGRTASHIWEKDAEKSVEATCIDDGLEILVCKTCKVQGEEKVIKASEEHHVWDEGTMVPGKEPTCYIDKDHTGEGLKEFKCMVTGCPATKTERVAGLEHEYTKYVKSVPESCTENGYVLMACHRCLTSTQTAVIAKVDHDKVLLDSTDGKYVFDESTYGTDNVNTAALSADVIKALTNGKVQTKSSLATCEKDGEKVYACRTCGKEMGTQTEKALGHEMETELDADGETVLYVKADGTKVAGLSCIVANPEVEVKCKHATCDNANKTFKTTIPVVHGDTLDTETTKATCKVEGVLSKVCKDCGNAVGTEVIEKTDHNWGTKAEAKVIRKQTCITDGIYEYTCSICKDKKTETEVKTGVHEVATDTKAEDPKERQYAFDYVAPVCGGTDAEGNSLKKNGSGKCKWCGMAMTIPAADGHTKPATGVVEATCETAGGYTCATCNAPVVTPATGHEEMVEVSATCETPGMVVCLTETTTGAVVLDSTTQTYKVVSTNYELVYDEDATVTVGKDKIRVIELKPMGAHSWEVEKEPTCTEKGLEKCIVCKTTRDIEPTGHTMVEFKPATCTEAAIDKCSVCGHTATSTKNLATGHEFDLAKGAVVAKPATCTEVGLVRCAHCTAVEEIEALGHDKVYSVHASCGVEGKWSCSRCDVKDQKEAALEHKYEKQESGLYYCGQCKTTITEEDYNKLTGSGTTTSRVEE